MVTGRALGFDFLALVLQVPEFLDNGVAGLHRLATASLPVRKEFSLALFEFGDIALDLDQVTRRVAERLAFFVVNVDVTHRRLPRKTTARIAPGR